MNPERLRTDLRRLAQDIPSAQTDQARTESDRFTADVKRRARRRVKIRDTRLVLGGAASMVVLIASLVIATDARTPPPPALDRLPASSIVLPASSDALLDAIRSDDIERVDLLLAAGADPDATVRNGITALMVATFRGRSDIALRLLDAGAQVDAVNVHGQRALHVAALADHADLARLLVAAGAEPNRLAPGTPALGKMTPLMTAARSGSVATVEALLASGADATLDDATGRPTVFFALDAPDDAATEAVLREFQQADVSITDPRDGSESRRLRDMETDDLVDLLDSLDHPRTSE